MRQIIIIFLLFLIFDVTATFFQTQLTDQFFTFSGSSPSSWLTPVENTNVYSQIYSTIICGQVSLLGGLTSNINTISNLFSQLPSHYGLSVSFYIYTIDTTVASPDTQISISIDNTNPTYELTQSTASVSTQICNGPQNDLIWKFNVTNLPHTANSLLLNVSIHNTTVNTFWGIRNLRIQSSQLCHPTCLACTAGSEFDCTGCLIGAVAVDGSCPDVTVAPAISPTTANLTLSSCDSEIEVAAPLLLFLKNSTVFESLTNEIYINTTIQVLFNKTTVSQSCRSSLTMKVLYKNSNNQILSFPDQFLSYAASTQIITISLPLSQARQLTSLVSQSYSSTLYTLSIKVLAGNTQVLLRDHHFDLLLVLDGTGTLPFLFDSDPLQTQTYCNGNVTTNCQEATIVDLDIEGRICQDVSCSQLYPQGQAITKTIGDDLIVKLSFKDSSFTKSLSLQHVFMRADNVVLDLSQISEVLQNDLSGSIIVSTLLASPSSSALFQYNLNIQLSNSSLRALSSSSINTYLQQSPQSFQALITVTQPLDSQYKTIGGDKLMATISCSLSRIIGFFIFFFQLI